MAEREESSEFNLQLACNISNLKVELYSGLPMSATFAAFASLRLCEKSFTPRRQEAKAAKNISAAGRTQMQIARNLAPKQCLEFKL
ncbi:MAG TPA: hypothetical protein VNO70_01720 [Blastocatellia bacterium]|nr:hypothetical protein [Blastocatellia bacterium]